MEQTNGTGHPPGQSRTVLGARRRVSAVPRTLLFDVETVADGVVTMVGYCKGRSDGYGPCPTSVTMEADVAYAILMDASWPEATDEEIAAWDKRVVACAESGEDPGPSPIANDGTVYHFNRAAEVAYRRDLLIAVIPALGQNREAASVLAGDDGDWLEMLRDLGWWRAAAEEALPQLSGEEAEASTPAGTDSSPTSAPSTESAPATS